jgi:hypothetical protein
MHNTPPGIYTQYKLSTSTENKQILILQVAKEQYLDLDNPLANNEELLPPFPPTKLVLDTNCCCMQRHIMWAGLSGPLKSNK